MVFQHPYRADSGVSARLVAFVLGEVRIRDFEAWFYDTPELESMMSATDHLALLSLDYGDPDAERTARDIVRRYVDMAQVETQMLRRIAEDIIAGGAAAFDAAVHAYEQYCRGYSFLDNLGLGFGLSFLDAAHREQLSGARKRELVAAAGSSLEAEAKRVIEWLDEGLVKPTGNALDYRIMEYIDHRPEVERRPTAYTRHQVEAELPGLGLWDQLKKGLGLKTTPELLARDRFRIEHPQEEVAWTRLAADEPARFVVAIYFGTTRPPKLSFYEVAKANHSIRRIRHDSAYRPARWR